MATTTTSRSTIKTTSTATVIEGTTTYNQRTNTNNTNTNNNSNNINNHTKPSLSSYNNGRRQVSFSKRGCFVVLAVIQITVLFDASRNNPRTNSNSRSELRSRSMRVATTSSMTKNTATMKATTTTKAVVDGSTPQFYPTTIVRTNDEGGSNSNSNSNRNSKSNSNDENEDENEDEDEDEDEENDDDDDDDDDDDTGGVYWMNYQSLSRKESDYYSGSWYMPLELFTQSLNAKEMNTLEDASGHAVYYENKKQVRMSYDWFDFSVEHLSKWYGGINAINAQENEVAFDKITTNLFKYIQSTPQHIQQLFTSSSSSTIGESESESVGGGANNSEGNEVMTATTTTTTNSSSSTTASQLPLLHPTIAIIAFGPITTDDADSMRLDKTRERSTDLTIVMLGATISSILRLGVGRIVCIGITEEDETFVTDTFALLRSEYKNQRKKQDNNNNDLETFIELAYVKVTDKTTYRTDAEQVNRPKAAIRSLQIALQHKNSSQSKYVEKWLGTKQARTYWKYIYFTEPDLVLQSRTSSIPSYHQQLAQGHILMPHRIQSIPHEDDLQGYSNTGYLKAVGNFQDVIELTTTTTTTAITTTTTNNDTDTATDTDTNESSRGTTRWGDLCCDGGIKRPTDHFRNRNDPIVACYTFWYGCGFLHEYEKLEEKVKHHRLYDHYTPLIRLTSGTQLVSLPASEHGRKCHPVTRTSVHDVCQRPTAKSQRSYSLSQLSSQQLLVEEEK